MSLPNLQRQKRIISFVWVVWMILPSLSAQTYQPFPTENATWNVSRCWYFFQPGWHDTYALTMDGSDTLYQGEVYKQIWMTQHLVHGPMYDTIYPPQFFGGLREEGKRIFMFQTWASVDTTAHLIYDFNATNVGDTIYTSALFGPASTMYGHIVKAVDSVLVGGQYHKQLLLQHPEKIYETEEWIEGIGSTWGLPFATVWSITDNSYDLTCFYQDGHLSYGNPSPSYAYCQPPYPESSCDSVVTSVGDVALPDGQAIWIFPNPAHDQVIVEVMDVGNDAELEIWSMMGQRVWYQHTPEEQTRIDVHDMAPGLYVILYRSRDKVRTGRLSINR
ncbi:MAG: T9SS type A sorting domain-containing protein [Saprospiraceae bacterium]|nr:T9SS type A sorting domain-containing protein [Saprospiraceae bacterium]